MNMDPISKDTDLASMYMNLVSMNMGQVSTDMTLISMDKDRISGDNENCLSMGNERRRIFRCKKVSLEGDKCEKRHCYKRAKQLVFDNRTHLEITKVAFFLLRFNKVNCNTKSC